jgi:hypothetical protein
MNNQLYLDALQNIVRAINALISPLTNVVQKISGLSVLGNSGTVAATAAPIIGTASQFLEVNAAGTALGFATMAGDATLSGPTITVANNAISNAKFRQSAGLSVVGNSGTATANVADIAGTAAQVLRVNDAGTALAFGQVDLGQSAAVTGTVPVGNGGTGDSSFTAYAVICGGSGALQNVSGVGSSGQLLTSNGAAALPTWQNAPASGAGIISPTVQHLTSCQTVTIPTNATKLRITLVGGGGGGAGEYAFGSSNGMGGPGGGAAACIKYLSSLTPGNTVVLTIGGSGSGGAAGQNNGSNGGDTTLTSGTQSITTLTGGGGVGGTAAISAGINGAPGAGGTATNGDLNIPGATGFTAATVSSPYAGGASALYYGPTVYQNFPSTTNTSVAGNNGIGFGGGGLGGLTKGTGAAAAGGNGSAGCAIFEWYA